MALTYNPIRNKNSYISALGGNPSRIANLNTVYSSISAIDLQNLILRYNALEFSNNVNDLNTLKADIDDALASIESLKHAMPADNDVLAPANDMKMRLSTVRSATESRIRHYNSSFANTKVGQFIDNSKRGMSKVVKAYKKITKPARGAYDIVEQATKDGGASIYESIANWGKKL